VDFSLFLCLILTKDIISQLKFQKTNVLMQSILHLLSLDEIMDKLQDLLFEMPLIFILDDFLVWLYVHPCGRFLIFTKYFQLHFESF
jgi:hypothetical protein